MRVFAVACLGLMLALPAAAQIPIPPQGLPPQAPPPTAVAPWQIVSGKDLGFVTAFPGSAVRKDDVRPTLVGPEQRVTFTLARANGDLFSVLQDDYRQTGGANADPQALVNSALGGALRNAGGTILSQGQFVVPGGAGREAMISAGGLFARFRYYYIWPFLFQVTAVTSSKEGQKLLGSGDFARFFDSFHLTGQLAK